MSKITQQDLHKQMQVYSEDRTEMGHIIEIYEDSFEVHKHLLGKHIYLTYSTVAAIEGEQVHLNITADETEKPSWQKRPDYEKHLGDPTQLFYDRGHGIHDPFDETPPNKS